LFWACGAAASAADDRFEGPYHIESKPVRRIRAVVTQTITFPDMQVGEWGVLVSSPPEYDGQRDLSGDLRVPGHPEAVMAPEVEQGSRHQRLWLVRWEPSAPDEAQRGKIEATYEVTLRSRRLVPGPPERPVPPLAAAERRASLRAEGFIDHDDPGLRRWLRAHDLKRQSGERDLDFAARVLRTLATTHTYRWVPGADPAASTVCGRGWGECGALSFLFVAALRANGVPARALAGRIARASTSDFDPATFHVAAEFFAEGIGWVPADPAVAVGSRGGNVRRALGNDPGRLLILHFDGVVIEGKPTVLQTAGFAIRQGTGSAAGVRIADALRVEELPLDRSDKPAAPKSRPRAKAGRTGRR
jgi:hypothetical protein